MPGLSLALRMKLSGTRGDPELEPGAFSGDKDDARRGSGVATSGDVWNAGKETLAGVYGARGRDEPAVDADAEDAAVSVWRAVLGPDASASGSSSSAKWSRR